LLFSERGGKMKRVLVADDTKNIRNLITTCLEADGYEVLSAKDGQEAFDLIQNEKIDLAFLDIKMPVMNGLELIAKCKEEKLDFSFVVLTNLEEFELAKKALTLGASEYLVKINLTEESLVNSLNKAKQHFDQITACNTNRMVNSFIEAGKEEITKTFFKKLLLSSQNYSTIDDVVLPDKTDKLNTFTEHEKQIAERFVSPLLIMLNISYSNAEYIKEDKQDDIKKIAAHASGIISYIISPFGLFIFQNKPFTCLAL